MNIGESLRIAHSQIQSASETPGLDGQLLLAHVLGRNRAWVVAHPETELSNAEKRQFDQIIAQRELGVPVPYLLGWWEFYGRRFKVSQSVLIPRPETELLLETAITFAKSRQDSISVLDVGTGSGCIAVSLAAERSPLDVTAIDTSMGALSVARENAEEYGVSTNIHFVQMDLVSGLRGRFDLVCANLPYIPTHEMSQLKVAKWEPAIALNGGEGGLAHIRRLLADLPGVVRSGALVLLEIDRSHGERVKSMAERYFSGAKVQIEQDLAGWDRMISLRV